MGTKEGCKAPRCRDARDAKHLMCRMHWTQVPDGLKRLVVGSYRQRRLGPAHVMAMDGAIFAVGLLEGLPGSEPACVSAHIRHRLELDAEYAHESAEDAAELLTRLRDVLPESEARLAPLREAAQSLLDVQPWKAIPATGG